MDRHRSAGALNDERPEPPFGQKGFTCLEIGFESGMNVHRNLQYEELEAQAAMD
jgi:hypothetical protein